MEMSVTRAQNLCRTAHTVSKPEWAFGTEIG